MGRTEVTRTTMPPENEHEWFRRHLPDQLLELLVEGEQRRFDAHARRCAPCARLLAGALGAKADWWDGAGHPPVGVLLAWDPAARAEPQRDPVRSHLEHCEDCVRDLEDLRGAAVAAAIVPAPAVAPQPLARSPRRILPSWGRLVGAAGVLVAASAAALLWPRAAGHAPRPADGPVAGLREAPPTTQAEPSRPPSPTSAPAEGRAAATVDLGAADRGAGAGPVEIRIEPGDARVPLTLPALPVDDEAMLVVELRDAAGRLLQRQVLVAGRALQPGGVVLPAAELAAGPHVLVVRFVDPATGETSREIPLVVRISR